MSAIWITLCPVDQGMHDGRTLPERGQPAPRAVPAGPKRRCRHEPAKSRPSFIYGGMILRSSSSSLPSAPRTADKITFKAIRFMGSNVRNSLSSGQFAIHAASPPRSLLVSSETLTVESRCEQSSTIVVLAAVEREYRTRTEELAQVRLIVAQSVGARRPQRLRESWVGDDHTLPEEWNVESEDWSVPLEPIPHCLAPNCGQHDALDERG